MEHNDNQQEHMNNQSSSEHSVDNNPAQQEEYSNTESTQSHIEKNQGLAQYAKENRGKKFKSHSRSHSFLSGIIGGLISAVVVVFLFTSNIIPISSSDSNDGSASAEQDSKDPEITQTIASGDGDVASSIDETSEAVVGVLNLQQQNVWTQSKEAGSGSGIIYKKEDGKAYVVTNNHVVEGAEEVEVVLNDEEHIKAKVLGSDALTDLAVLEIDGSKIETVAKLGSSEDLKVGETVIAIGNPLGMTFSGSVTKGIVSGLERSIDIDTNGDNRPDWVTEVIQTDAAINPGNSGGALVNSDGEVVGINSMKIAQETVEGIGLAIPIDSALPIMEQLETKGEVARPFIGISTAALEQVPRQYQNRIQLPEDVDGGMVIAAVETGSPAADAGLKQFDIITKINDQKITTILDLRKYMYSETSIGDKVKVEFYRDGKKQTTELTLAERKEN
ncbi:S1C family serine protease [Virgibacillus oceani]|uniref:Serine protease YyxA n=1 Tax=Virgibacillus oceani TaxID=1479511 RepID=A0A917M767_9BACI|nr:S1C family serine protease [Virgibacillus oceani]GGG81851.1 putative serine protease YyxA [Virgibacillus oceani]